MLKTLKGSLSYTPVELSFGTSGLRGLAVDMTDLECYINTRGFLDFCSQKDSLKSGSTVALAGDFRDSTPRISKAVAQAILDAGYQIDYLGNIPTPAAAFYILNHNMPLAMVTGSHIPADRNGIKFYKTRSEVLKHDESGIKDAVAKIREYIYSQDSTQSAFNNNGSLKKTVGLPKIIDASTDFLNRYTSLFSQPLSGKKIIVYQHSSLAADFLVELVKDLGADTIPVDRSSEFIPIDTENITPENQAYFKSLAKEYPGCFAIISADGDADRPFIVDETGTFHRGDIVGAVTAEFLKVKSAAVPVSTSDAIDVYLDKLDIKLVHTKIGSPYVIEAMETLGSEGNLPVVGWEVNGGFLTGSEIKVGSQSLASLPTRDAFLPIICTLVAAAQKHHKLSELFAQLPPRFTQAGLLDSFPIEASRSILDTYSDNTTTNYGRREKFFNAGDGFSKISNINSLDGIRITFNNGDIAHVRPSGNAPQLRIYSVANSQARANKIVAAALAEPDGILRQLEKNI